MRIGESPFRRLLTRDSLGEATALAFISSDRKGATVAKLTVKLFRNRLATSGSTPERSINGVHGQSEGWPASHSLPLIGARPGVGERPETESGRRCGRTHGQWSDQMAFGKQLAGFGK